MRATQSEALPSQERYTMSQVATVGTTVRQVIGRAPFRRGFDDAWAGKPLRYDLEPPPGGGSDTNRQWAYERGRLFAAYCKSRGVDPRPLKQGNRVRFQAQVLLSDAIQCRAVR